MQINRPISSIFEPQDRLRHSQLRRPGFPLLFGPLNPKKAPPDPPQMSATDASRPGAASVGSGRKGRTGDDIRLPGHRMTAAPEQIKKPERKEFVWMLFTSA